MPMIGEMLETLFLITYFFVLTLLCIYGIHRYQLVYLFYKHRNHQPQKTPIADTDLPHITVQVPVFNERYVVARLLHSLRDLDYPRDRLEIQVLDDSTDETQLIVQKIVDELRRDNLDIKQLHRSNRQGYKAGALGAGLKIAKGEFIAIFDADFLPDASFLRDTIGYFSSKKIGMVQTRWGYLNRQYSLLTRLQAIYLDAHFSVEHFARNRSGRFFNFNGTAGIWRKQCLLSAGGWQTDTLTEDLDISYRAQMAGWQFVFVPEVVAPSELPVEMNSFKLQQHRWAKGSIQTAIKLLPKILKSPLSWKIKLEAVFHLTNNLSYLLMIYLSLSMLPSMIIRFNLGWEQTVWIDLIMLLAATMPVTLFYITAERALYRDWRIRILHIPALMALGIGIAVNNGKAVLEALLGIQSEFKRTPKHGIKDSNGTWRDKKYSGPLSLVIIGELLLSIYFAFTVYLAVVSKVYIALPFLLLFLFGFSYVFFASVIQRTYKFAHDSWGLPAAEQSGADN